MCRKNETGFSLVSAIFILVVLAVLGAALLTVSTLRHASAGIDVQGVRGYQAAASGVEWGLYRLLDPDGAPAAALPACWAGTASVTPGGSLAAFAVATTCTRATTTELGRDIGVYTIVSGSEIQDWRCATTTGQRAPASPNREHRLSSMTFLFGKK